MHRKPSDRTLREPIQQQCFSRPRCLAQQVVAASCQSAATKTTDSETDDRGAVEPRCAAWSEDRAGTIWRALPRSLLREPRVPFSWLCSPPSSLGAGAWHCRTAAVDNRHRKRKLAADEGSPRTPPSLCPQRWAAVLRRRSASKECKRASARRRINPECGF